MTIVAISSCFLLLSTSRLLRWRLFSYLMRKEKEGKLNAMEQGVLLLLTHYAAVSLLVPVRVLLTSFACFASLMDIKTEKKTKERRKEG
jgi:hypothetical protein